ncbi:uncharacterized protein LOC106993930 [Macaca mulatta]
MPGPHPSRPGAGAPGPRRAGAGSGFGAGASSPRTYPRGRGTQEWPGVPLARFAARPGAGRLRERIVGPGPAFGSVRPAVTRMRGGPQGRGPGRPCAESPPEAQELRTLGLSTAPSTQMLT